MFLDFFYLLRARGLPVGTTEWLGLMEALGMGLEGQSLSGFYHLCRALCVKTEAHLDLYDQCFAEHFRGVEVAQSVKDELAKWLENPILPRALTEEELAQLKALDLDELRRLFEERMREQTERHDGGSRWIGTGGTSPFGQGGQHPTGVRVGEEGGGRSAMQVASQRRFRNLRNDLTLDVRQIGVALRRLRLLTREGQRDELDLDGSIDATARNAGEIDLLFRPERRNRVKLLLLMDVGGSMTPYTRLSEQLFSAAHGVAHFQAFRSFFFHNCVYESLYTDIERRQTRPTLEVLEELDASWFCVLVGDAAMHPYELTMAGGAVDYYHRNEEPGVAWLHRLRRRFPRSAWLNPDPPHYWSGTSVQMIRQIFDMFPLTLDGLDEAVEHLRRARRLHG
jgi:uncharacterized protein with von Willebrand factor type A (vWA) domain